MLRHHKLLFLMFVTLLSCSKKQGADYFPISNGNVWEYNLQFMTFTGIIDGKMVIRIDGEEEIGGKKYLKQIIVYSGIPGAEPEIDYFRRSEEGIYQVSGKYKNSGEFMYVPFPIEVGKSWEVDHPEGKIYYEIEGIETAELFDRKYENCLRMSWNWPSKSSNGYSYLSKGIGEVKSFGEVEGVKYETNLVKHTIN